MWLKGRQSNVHSEDSKTVDGEKHIRQRKRPARV
jgi:hypothetical protein